MQGASTIKAARRKIEWLLFAAAFFAYGYFHQGGGWAQNARFAMVRAIVEENHYWIDNFLIYFRVGTAEDDTVLARVPVRDATFKIGGATYALTWTDPVVETSSSTISSIREQSPWTSARLR